MQELSEIIYEDNIGFFKYNYDLERLELFDRQSCKVSRFWEISKELWGKIPFRREYCQATEFFTWLACLQKAFKKQIKA